MLSGASWLTLAATLHDASSFVTTISHAPLGCRDSLLMLAASEDDHVRLYNVDGTAPTATTPTTMEDDAGARRQRIVGGQVEPASPSESAAPLATYRFSGSGVARAVFAQSTGTALVCPRSWADKQVFLVDLETGRPSAAYSFEGGAAAPHAPAASPSKMLGPSPPSLTPPTQQQQQAGAPFFSALLCHPTAQGVFLCAGEGAPVSLYHVGVSRPIGSIAPTVAAASRGGRPVCDVSPDGLYFAVAGIHGSSAGAAGSSTVLGGAGTAQPDMISIYDYRRLGAGPVSAHVLKGQMPHGARWLSDMGSVTGLHWRPNAAAGTEGANGKRELLVTTSRYVVRTIDSDTGAVLVAHGTTGAGAGYLPNDRPPAFARKRQLPPCARYSPDGTAVAMGSFLHRTIIFDAASGDLVHLLKGRHASMVGCVEWNPTHPMLTAACRTVNVWHTPRPLTAPTAKSPFAL